MKDYIGRVLDGKYELTRLLGEGGMGGVFEAEHTVIKRVVAVKVMNPAIASNAIAVERFFREAQAASAIGHPNIIEIHDVGKDGETVFMVMELLQGESLHTVLSEKGPLTPPRATDIMLQVLSALHAAHQKGIIHRDMKAENVFLAVDARMREEVKLLDFGIAKVVGGEDDPDLGLTQTGTVMGTPYYLSPEQARGGKEIDHRIDIWSAGVLLYEMLTGALPFEGENYNEILSKILMDEPIPIGQVNPTVPEALADVVSRALVKDRDDRYLTVSSMIKDLMQFHDGGAGRMSTSVAQAIRNSVAPPPINPDLEETIQPETAAGDASPEPPPVDEIETPAVTGSKRGSLLLFGGTVVVIGLAVAAFFLIGGEGSNDPSTGEVATGDEPSDPTASAAASSSSPARPDAGRGEETSPSGVVRLELEGLPAGARVTLDGERIKPPAELPRSSRPMILKVAAPGYRPHEQALVTDRDLTIDLELVRTTGRKAGPAGKGQASKTRTGKYQNPYNGKSNEKKKPKEKVWADNPFAK